jgi:hypothetical protein
MNSGKYIQVSLFESIFQGDKIGKIQIEELGNLLNLSKSAIYKRISGETLLDIHELATLFTHYHININELISKESDAETDFKMQSLISQPTSIKDYLNFLINDLNSLANQENALMRFGALELPLFHFYDFFPLMAFRIYIQSRYSWELPEFVNKKFSLQDFMTPELIELMEDVNSAYCKVPSIEIWSNFTMDIFLNQILYHTSMGLFEDPNDAYLILKELKLLNNKLLEGTATDKKTYIRRDGTMIQSSFKLYQIEFLNVSTHAIMTSDNLQKIYFTYDSPNVLISSNKRLIHYSINWFEKVRKRAFPLDKNSERNRFRFFNRMESKINEYEKEIRFLIEK